MARKFKIPAPRKVKRNPLARALGNAKYRARVVPKPGAYQRRAKHTRPVEPDDA